MLKSVVSNTKAPSGNLGAAVIEAISALHFRLKVSKSEVGNKTAFAIEHDF